MDEEDMSREIFPLSHYATNRGRLINEAFNIIRSHRLESTIVPPSFRKHSHTELKAMCLEELEKIDTLRIVDIIEGRLTSSPKNETVRKRKSSSSSKSSEDDDTVKVKKIAKVAVDLEDAKKEPEGKKKKKKKKKLKAKEAAAKHVKKNKAKVKGKKAKLKKKLEKKQKKEAEAPKPVMVGGERTLMELLELEYRAKAIKALLKFQGFGNTKLDEIFDDKPSENSPGPSSVIAQPCGTREQVQSSTSKSTNPPQSTDPSSSQAPAPKKVVEEPPKQNPDPAPCEQASTTASSSHSAASIVEKPEEEESADENRFELSIDIEDDLDFESLSFPQKESTPASSSCDAESQAQSPTKSAVTNTTKKKKNETSDEEAEEVKFSRRSVRKHSRHPRRRSTKSSDESPEGPSRSSPSVPSPEKVHSSPPKSKRSTPKTKVASPITKLASPKTKLASPKTKLASPITKLASPKMKLASPKTKPASSMTKHSSPKSKHSSPKPKHTFILLPRNHQETDAQKPQEELKTDEEIPKQPSPAEEGEIKEDGDGIDNVSSNEDTLNSPFNNSDHEKDKVSNEISEEKSSPVEVTTEVPDKVLDSPEKPLDEESEAIAEYPPPEDIPSAETTSCDVPKSTVVPEGIENEEDEAINKSEPPRYPEEATPITWYERWYSSKKVQKVVSSTKMYGKLRNKMISGKKSQVPNPKNQQPQNQVNPKSLLDGSKKGGVEQPESSEHHDIPIIGSIEEYEKLFGKRIVSQNLDASPSVVSAQEPPKRTVTEEKASQEVDEEDEAEDDELWGDILGK